MITELLLQLDGCLDLSNMHADFIAFVSTIMKNKISRDIDFTAIAVFYSVCFVASFASSTITFPFMVCLTSCYHSRLKFVYLYIVTISMYT